LLPPESAALEDVSREVGIGVDTLQRWRSEALAQPARDRVWTAAARFDAVLTTAAMDEAGKSAWCRSNGLYTQELMAWRQSAVQALTKPEETRASPQPVHVKLVVASVMQLTPVYSFRPNALR